MSFGVKEWDGTGPKRECLLRVIWESDVLHEVEWMHFDWRDADSDGVDDGESTEFTCNPDEYFNEPSSLTVSDNCGTFEPSDRFTITHWANVPTVEDI